MRNPLRVGKHINYRGKFWIKSTLRITHPKPAPEIFRITHPVGALGNGILRVSRFLRPLQDA